MNILIVSQYFWPESFIINDIVKLLRDRDYQIVIATGKPNYPEGKIFDWYDYTETQIEICWKY